MGELLTLDGLTGGYVPGKPVLRNVSFSVAPGEMVGLIGLNGAGKSTTIKHILGLMRPQEGTVTVNGVSLETAPDVYRSSFAYVPESPELYEELTVIEHLELTARAYGLDPSAFERRSDELLRMFRLDNRTRSFPAHLSKGMRQKVMLMNAFLVEPPLYIIDEPFLGLDPLGIRSLLDMMVRFKRAGAGFLISSHILSTIQAYCDRFVVLHEGRVAAAGTMSDIARAAGLDEAALDDIFYALVTGDRQ